MQDIRKGNDMQHIDDKGVDNLICGIVRKAVDDWQKAKRRLRKCPNSQTAQGIVIDCESFFKSEYFYNLTGMDGHEFLKKLKAQSLKECQEERRGRRARV